MEFEGKSLEELLGMVASAKKKTYLLMRLFDFSVRISARISGIASGTLNYWRATDQYFKELEFHLLERKSEFRAEATVIFRSQVQENTLLALNNFIATSSSRIPSLDKDEAKWFVKACEIVMKPPVNKKAVAVH